MQQQVNSPAGILSIFGDAWQTVSAFPGKIIDFGEGLNDRIIELGQEFQEGSAAGADNLRDTKIRTAGGNFSQWISQPQNLTISAVILAAVIWAISK